MAKNELLPFADGEDANVLPTNQWEALTDILENGFQSGIAKSEQVNRVLAQGAVASYVLGQLIVDQLNKDATLDKDTLYQNIVQALQENAKDACLPLSGGTMMGAIRFNDGNSIYQTKDSDGVNVYGGSDTWKGAGLQLFGMSHTGNEGCFQIYANNGSISSGLRGTPSGSLTWGGKNVVCVESWKSYDGSLWYRKYADGWIEQGGVHVSESAQHTITAATPFTTTNYTILANIVWNGDLSMEVLACNVYQLSTTQISIFADRYPDPLNAGNGITWYACGY